MLRALAAAITTLLALTACGSPDVSAEPTSPYRQTQEEFLLLTRSCIEDAGFEVELSLDESGFSFPDLGSDQRAGQARQALRDCMREVDPERLEDPPERTRAQLEALYPYAVAQRECMAEAGYPAPDPPPLDVFIDQGANWEPYTALSDQGIAYDQEDLVRCQNVEEKPDFLDW